MKDKVDKRRQEVQRLVLLFATSYSLSNSPLVLSELLPTFLYCFLNHDFVLLPSLLRLIVE